MSLPYPLPCPVENENTIESSISSKVPSKKELEDVSTSVVSPEQAKPLL
jgi:hypothetical protein